MQLVTSIDIEDALRLDLEQVIGDEDLTVCAPPAPDDLEPNTVCVTALGGAEDTAVSDRYDVSVDCWAATIEGAYALARTARSALTALPLRDLASGREYKTTTTGGAYSNPDPDRPTIPRATFTARVTLRGIPINL